MKVRRHPANPLIRPADVLPSRPDFSVVCVFNCGVIRHKGEVLLLMRVAEKPAGGDADAVLVPVYDEGSGRIEVKRFDRMLLDENEPWKVVARSREPLLAPETDYELHGFYGNVVFCCGALFEGGDVKIYYGAADTCIAYAEVGLHDVLDSLS